MRLLSFLLFLLCNNMIYAQGIIPQPTIQEHHQGIISLQNIAYITYQDKSQEHLAQMINKELFNNQLAVQEGKRVNAINLLLPKHKVLNEEYEMGIGSNEIDMYGTVNGIFYAAMSLKQLMINYKGLIPCQQIEDKPAFVWRGMHLDVSRHFFSTDFVKKYIDILALHKMNSFHWHLTDDQGWRIEIKKYPKLTQIGSKRKETMLEKNFNPYKGDETPYEGFYTQEQIKEVVAYAKERFINVVPEIEMPGHGVAALSAYPEFSCNQKPLEALTQWGVSDDIFCTKDSTFTFLFDVLDEVLELFPSTYIHIGGDEAPKARWKSCTECQANIKMHHLKNEDELQSYFLTRIDSFLTSKGRQTIGWDEILDGGLAPNASVMSWRGEEGGIAAAKLHHKVVMTPGSYCYFDHYQGDKKLSPLAIGGFTTVKKVYGFNPIPAVLTNEESNYILGAQGNLWTEYISTPEHAMYMALPRLCALSEVLWTGKQRPSYENFTQRLITHFSLLDSLNINYAKNIFDIRAETSPDGKGINLVSDFVQYNIRFTHDGSNPNKNSKLIETIPLDKSKTIKAQVFDGEIALGNIFSQEYTISKSTGKNIKLIYDANKHYNSGGAQTLVNGIVGTLPWSGNEWLGWTDNKPMYAIIDLETEQDIHKLKVSYLEAKESWIHLPESVEIYTSNSGDIKDAKKLLEMKYWNSNFMLEEDVNFKTRYLIIKANPIQKIPAGFAGAGESAWLFCSEIIVE